MPEWFIANLRAVLRWALPLALAALPFELAVGLRLGGLILTNVELLLLFVLGLWALGLATERRWPLVPGWLLGGGGALLAALLISAALAVEQRDGALKFALRQAQGLLLALATADLLRREGDLLARRCVAGLLASAGLSALLGLWELTELPLALAVVAPFKGESSFVGGLIRLGGTFSYANTAAMYYEALLPLALLGACSLSQAAGGWRRAWFGQSPAWPLRSACDLLRPGAWLLAALLLLATLLTYSRAALGVSLLLLIVTPALARLGLGRRAGLAAAIGCAALVALPLALALLSPLYWLRIAEPDVTRWYGVAYAAPARIAPLAPNELRNLPITLRNNGRVAWEPDGQRPVRLAYHWVNPATGRVIVFEGRRTLLPRRVAPGEAISVTATVQAPRRPGRYLLVWDMLREYIGRGWFSQMGIAPAEVAVEVVGPAWPSPPPSGTSPSGAPRTIAAQPGPPGRGLLWRTALALWLERPLVGIGPDVFRHVYGPRIGLVPWDDRVHTNNLYLELLTGAGALGLAAFLGLSGAALLAAGRSLDRRRWPVERWLAAAAGELAASPRQILLVGALLGLLAFLAHGLLDVFLAFTPTYALLWVLIGALAGLAEIKGIAPR